MKNEDRREKKMKNFILVFVMFIMTGVVYGQSSVYINQSGSGLDLDITLDGDGSSVGASNDITQIIGEDLDIVIDLDASSTVTGDVYITGDGASVDELNLTSQGNGVAYTLAIGANGDLSVGTSVIETRTNANSGSTTGGTSIYTIGAISNSGDYTDIDVVLKGSQIDINLLDNSTGGTSSNKSTTAVTMGTDSADVDTDIDKTGAGNSDITLNIVGSAAGSDYTVYQSGAGAHATTLQINGTSAGSNFNVQQSGGNATTVSGTFAGASSSNVDIIITE